MYAGGTTWRRTRREKTKRKGRSNPGRISINVFEVIAMAMTAHVVAVTREEKQQEESNTAYVTGQHVGDSVSTGVSRKRGRKPGGRDYNDAGGVEGDRGRRFSAKHVMMATTT